MTAPWSTAAGPTFSHPRPEPAPTRRPADAPRHPLLDPLPGCGDRCRVARVEAESTRYLTWARVCDAAAHEAYGEQQVLLPAVPVVTAQLTVDLAAGRVTVGEHTNRPPPTATEWRILAYLTERVGQLCSADEILTAVWGPEYRGEHHLARVNLSRLRDTLGCAGRLIEMRMRLGWRLLGEPPRVCEPGCTGVYVVRARGADVEARVLAVLRVATAPLIAREIGDAVGLTGGGATAAIVRLRRQGYEISGWTATGGGYRLVREPS